MTRGRLLKALLIAVLKAIWRPVESVLDWALGDINSRGIFIVIVLGVVLGAYLVINQNPPEPISDKTPTVASATPVETPPPGTTVLN